MKQTYSVQVHDPNSWFEDGSPVITEDCGHKHRTIAGAAKCMRRLYAYDPKTQTHSARWHRCDVYHSDGTELTFDETYQVCSDDPHGYV